MSNAGLGCQSDTSASGACCDHTSPGSPPREAARGPHDHDQLLLRPRLPSVGGRVGLAYESKSQLSVGERLLSGFLQRNQGESADPELGSAATAREALDPAPAAKRRQSGLEGYCLPSEMVVLLPQVKSKKSAYIRPLAVRVVASMVITSTPERACNLPVRC